MAGGFLVTVFYGKVLHFLRRPQSPGDLASLEFFKDGVLEVDSSGRVNFIGPRESYVAPLGAEIHEWTDRFILPGFVDTHTHYAQTDIVAAYGERLLDWLNLYTFPTERKFENPEYAQGVAEIFLDELLRSGTTTACVFPTVHKNSVDAFFSAASVRRMRMVCGKVMMDRNCPDWLADDVETAEKDSRSLIETWHGRDRLLYALTPRFAPTSTPEQLKMAGRLFDEYEGVYIQSHLAENEEEVQWVASLFPDTKGYLDVYNRFGLLGERAIYAHCVHLSDEDRKVMAGEGVSIAFAPSSNLFLGSGLFDYRAAQESGVEVGIASDIGAGTRFSILETLGEAYKVLQLRRQQFNSLEAMYLATLGGAKALRLEDKVGNFERGKEADVVVIDPTTDPILSRRCSQSSELSDELFVLMMLGGSNTVAATYTEGRLAYRRDSAR